MRVTITMYITNIVNLISMRVTLAMHTMNIVHILLPILHYLYEHY